MIPNSIRPVIVGEMGSFAHGLNVATSDHDFMGCFFDEPENLIGLRGGRKTKKDRDRPEGVKSEPGDEEGTFYSVRTYADLACKGNPTVMTLLFTPILPVPDQIGLQANRDMFLSKRLVASHMGYADSMAAQLTGAKAPRTNRPDLIAKHGWDTKAGFHAIRLLMQGHEMLARGTMTMPMESKQRQYLLDVRNGLVRKEQALEDIAFWRAVIQASEKTTSLPDDPDNARIDQWLIDVHTRDWDFQPAKSGVSQ